MPVTGTKAAASAQGYGLFGPSGSPVDPNFNSVSLLLHGDGTNGAQNNTFLDSSANNFTITRIGSATQGAFSPFALSGSDYNPSTNGGSVYFDGSSYLNCPSSLSAFQFGSGAFTVECWFYRSGNGSNPTFLEAIVDFRSTDTTSTNFSIGTISTNQIVTYGLPSGTSNTSRGSFTPNAWNHLAVVNDGTSFLIFVNGSQIYSVSKGASNYTEYNCRIGTGLTGAYTFNGYISNLRVIKGNAVYTSNFTPPTAPVTAISGTSLLCNFTNAGIFDNAAKNDLVTVGSSQVSSAQVKFGTGSMLFNGTTDYLILRPNSFFNLGTGDFTVEAWIFQTATNTYPSLLEIGSHQLTDSILFILNEAGPRVYSGAFYSIGNSYSLNTWNHIAFTRQSGVLKTFVNGASNAGVSFTNNITNQTSVSIAYPVSLGGSGYFFPGYIDDLRITKGVARYTSNFTPPTQAFPNR